ncbi:hypothetical protein [Amycolatopsis japonica]
MSDYELELPFLTVQSKGGPHEDVAYCAGWTMGHLDAVLEHHKPAMHEDTIYQDSVPQADIIAMRHGYRSHFVDGPDGWAFMTLIRVEDDRETQGFWVRLWWALIRRQEVLRHVGQETMTVHRRKPALKEAP